MANSLDPEQTAPIGAVCSGSTLFASILHSSRKLGNFLQQTTSSDDIFRCIFLGAFWVMIADLAYSKTCLNQSLIKRPKNICFQDKYSLNADQKYCSMWSILQYF